MLEVDSVFCTALLLTVSVHDSVLNCFAFSWCVLLLTVSFHDSVLICYYSRSLLFAVVAWFFSLIFSVTFQGETDYGFCWIYRTCNTQTSRNLTTMDFSYATSSARAGTSIFFFKFFGVVFLSFFLSFYRSLDHEILESLTTFKLLLSRCKPLWHFLKTPCSSGEFLVLLSYSSGEFDDTFDDTFDDEFDNKLDEQKRLQDERRQI